MKELLKGLNEMERILISPIIPFQQFLTKPSGGQKALKGNVVNVPADFDQSVNLLPRTVDDTEMIHVEFKRKQEYRHSYLKQLIHPELVIKSLQYLCEQPLFKEKNIKILEDWERKEFLDFMNSDDFKHYVEIEQKEGQGTVVKQPVPPAANQKSQNKEGCSGPDPRTSYCVRVKDHQLSDKEGQTTGTKTAGGEVGQMGSMSSDTKTQKMEGCSGPDPRTSYCVRVKDHQLSDKEGQKTGTKTAGGEVVQMGSMSSDTKTQKNQGEEADSDEEWAEDLPENAEEEPMPAQTVVSPLDMNPDPSALHMKMSVAPGEGKRPQSLLYMANDAMALCFPYIFNGHKLPIPKKMHISAFCKWLLMNVDRYPASCLKLLFFLMKRKQCEEVVSQIQVAMRKANEKGQHMDVSTLLQPTGLDTFVYKDEGFRVLRNIRGSPAYWEGLKKNIFAMLRQLGTPAFFFSLSAAETRWGFLLMTLSRNVDHKEPEITEEEALNLSWFEKCRLIRSDPTTCARYFDNKVRAFLNILCKKDKNGILGRVKDHVIRIEFQQVTTPKTHYCSSNNLCCLSERKSPCPWIALGRRCTCLG